MAPNAPALPELLTEIRHGAEAAASYIGANDRPSALLAIRKVLIGVDRAADAVARMQEQAARPD